MPIQPLRSVTGTPLTTDAGYQSFEISQPNVSGRNALSSEYTNTHFIGDMAARALDRLTHKGTPFSLTVSFHSPHAPMVAAPEYFDYYHGDRDRLFVSPSISDSMDNSAYTNSNGRSKLLNAGYGYDDPDQVRDTWKTIAYWQSDERLSFGRPVRQGSDYVRNEYLYIGRTASGTLRTRVGL